MKPVLGENNHTHAYKLADSTTLQLVVIGLLVGGPNAITSTQAYIEEFRGSLRKK